ncbi:DUF2523 family protein [Photobacterium leiognathi]|uniref:DUF2523 family protein n=1 Tax=Photobacterium leiognathi TaxID=553611 RepID=UPI0029820770|nr:DUF2523 family protein [Photobacterium leiognathi]
MGAVLQAIINFLTSGTFVAGLATLLGKLGLALGISFTVVQGIDAGIDYLVKMVNDGFAGVPSNIISLLAMYGIDHCFNIIMSAYLFVFSMHGINKVKTIPKFKLPTTN